MEKPLAKLSPPRFAVVYPRHRLFERLDQWSDIPALWVHAPAGYGKTTLIASYLQARQKPVCWYQVDDGDSEPASFVYYLSQLASQYGVTGLKPLAPEYRLGGVQAFARQFFRSFFGGLPEQAVWVLDSYQNAACAELDAIIGVALQEVPPGLQVVLTSRDPPPSSFARLQTTQQLRCLVPDDLLLSADETVGIFALHLPQVSDDTVTDVHHRTKGWAAGVMLLIEQHKNGAVERPAITNSQQQILFDYFADEVLRSMSTDLREMLLKTAFVPHITSDMAVALTGDPGAWQQLEDLAQRNYFTYHHDNGVPHCEYHPLFSDFLTKQARRVYDAETLEGLLRHSAQLLAASGRYEQAFKLYLAIEDWFGAVEIVLGQAQTFLQQGRDQTVYHWLQQLPTPLLDEQPWLQFWLGASKLATDPNLSYGHFEQAYGRFRQQDDLQGNIMAWLGSVDSIVYSLSGSARLDQWLLRYEEMNRAYRLAEQPDLQGQLASRLMGIFILRQPDHPQVAMWYAKAVDALWSIDDINQRLLTGFYLLSYNIWLGDLVGAAGLWERLVQCAPNELPPFAAATGYFGRAWLAWAQGDDAHCQSNIDKGLQLAQQNGVYIWYGMSLMMGSTNAFNHGKTIVADGYQQQLTPEIFSTREMDLAYYHNDRAAFRLAAGELLQANEAQKMALKTAEELGVLYTLADITFGMAQIQHALGDSAQAEYYLQRAEALGKRYGSWTKALQCSLLRAQFALDAGHEQAAKSSLQELFEQIRQKGFVTYNSLQPSALSRLFAFCLRHCIGQEIIPSLIQRYRLVAPKEETSSTWPWPVRIWTLGRFALEVNGQSIDLSGNKHRRPCDLLKLLLIGKPHGLSESSLADTLWPEREGDMAMRNLRTNLHRLRRLLGSEKAILVQQGLVCLNSQYCWSDLRQVQSTIQLIGSVENEKLADLRTKLRNDYSGPFLPSEETPHIFNFRNQLNTNVLQILIHDAMIEPPESDSK